MLQFKPELLLTKSKKALNISTEILLNTFIFSYKDKTHKINYEQYTIDIPENVENIEKYVFTYFENMLNKFNSNLRPHESKRILINVYYIQITNNLIKFQK